VSAHTQWHQIGGCVANVKNFGAKGDGTTDDSLAFQSTYDAAAGAGVPMYIPPGTYYVPTKVTATTANTKIVIRGAGIGQTIVKSKFALPPGSSNLKISYGLFKIENAASVTVEDLTLDGASTLAHGAYNTHYHDQQAMLELHNIGSVLIARVETTRMNPAIPGGGGTIHPDPNYRFNHGPVFIYDCDAVEIRESRFTTPSYGDGWTIVNSRNIWIGGFYSDVGFNSDPIYGAATAFNIFGQTTRGVTITNSQIINQRGSAMNIGGLGDIVITDNLIDGGDIDTPGGSGIDVGIESTTDVWPAHPVVDNITIRGNVLRQLNGHGIIVGGKTDGPQPLVIGHNSSFRIATAYRNANLVNGVPSNGGAETINVVTLSP